MTVFHAQKVLVSGCSHCNIINQTPQIRHIGCLFIPGSSVCIHQMNRVNSRNDYVMMTAP